MCRDSAVAESLLPRALLVPIGLKALAALVLRHFQTTFLFQITHDDEIESENVRNCVFGVKHEVAATFGLRLEGFPAAGATGS